MLEDRSVTADQDVLEIVRRVLANPRHVRVQSGLIGLVANSSCKFHERLTIRPMAREESVATRIGHPDYVHNLTEGVRVDDGLPNLDHKRLDGFHLITDSGARAKPCSLRAQQRRRTHKASPGVAEFLRYSQRKRTFQNSTFSGFRTPARTVVSTCFRWASAVSYPADIASYEERRSSVVRSTRIACPSPTTSSLNLTTSRFPGTRASRSCSCEDR